MKILGIEFAPLWIPIERRLQTAAVFQFCLGFLWLWIFVGVFIYLFFTSYYYLPLLYLTWMIYDRNICNEGGRPIPWIRNALLWRYLRDFFPIKLIKTAELDPKKNYVFGYHPHGVISFGAFCCFASEAGNFKKLFPGLKPHLLTLRMQFFFPFHRENVLATGICAATKESIEWLLTKEGTGNALVIVIGGAAESLNAHPGTAKLVLKKRKGFVRLALKNGASLVPVFAFGENDLYRQVPNPEGSKLRSFQNKFKGIFGFAPPIVYGRGIFQYSFGIIPYRTPVNVVVGKPIDLEKIPEPTEEEVDRAHKLYIEKLTELFEEHKTKYALNLKLIIA